MRERQTLADLVRDAIDKGATTAEEIHKAVADLPVEILQRLDLLGGPAKEMRRIQDLSIGAVYDLVREINHRVSDLASEFLGAHPRQ